MKFIQPTTHGYIDYLTIALFLAAPIALGLEGIPAILSYGLAGAHFLVTAGTDFSLGIFPVISFPLHGWVERFVGPALIIGSFFPMLTGGLAGQIFYHVMGLTIVVIGLLTAYQPEGNPRAPSVNVG